MFTVEQMLIVNPEFSQELFSDAGFVKHVNKHLQKEEYQEILMQRTALSDEQNKILTELKSDQMFCDWRYIENPHIKIKDIDNPTYQRYLIDQYEYYKKSWVEKIKSKLLEFNPYEPSSYQELQDIQEILLPMKKVSTLVEQYFTACATNAASSLIEMKRSLTFINVVLFVVAHAALIASVPAVVVVKLVLSGLTLARSMAASIIINTYFSTMALSYFFSTESNGNQNKSNINDRGVLSNFFTFMARNVINVLKFAVSIGVPLLLLTVDIIVAVAISAPLAIVGSLLSPIGVFYCYNQAYKFQVETEKNNAKNAIEAKNSYNQKLKTHASNNKIEISDLYKLLSEPEAKKFILICDTAQKKIKEALDNSSFMEVYNSIHRFQGSLNKLKDSSEIQNNSLIITIKDFISSNGPLVLNGSIKDAPALNDKQKEAINLLIAIFDAILKDKKPLLSSKHSEELPQSSAMIKFFTININRGRKLQPEHAEMISTNENQPETNKFNMISAKLKSEHEMSTTEGSSNRNMKMLTM